MPASVNVDERKWAAARRHVAKGELVEAERLLIGIIVESPRARDPWQALGTVYFRQNAFDKAIDAYRKLLELDPDDADANYSLAVAYKAGGRLNEAANHV